MHRVTYTAYAAILTAAFMVYWLPGALRGGTRGSMLMDNREEASPREQAQSVAGVSRQQGTRTRVEAIVESGTPTERAEALKAELFGSDLTVAEVAHILDVDRTTVLRYLRDDELFGYQIGREWRIPEHDLRAYRSRIIDARRREMGHAAGESKIELLLPRLNQNAIEGEAPPHAKIWCSKCTGPVLGELHVDGDTGDSWYQGECAWCNEQASEVYRHRPRRLVPAAMPPTLQTPLQPSNDSFEDDGDIPF